MDKKIEDLAGDIKKIDVRSMHLDQREDYVKLLLEGVVDKGFEQNVEQLLASFNKKTTDLPELQSGLILLIKDYISSHVKNPPANVDEKAIAGSIAEISHNLLKQKDPTQKAASSTKPSEDKYYSADSSSRKDFNRAVKYFATYEVYKAMNPRRIAGETKKDNFIHNVIVRGLDKATHYTGGSKSEIAAYSPNLVGKLEEQHKDFKNKGFDR